jgi:hypothetical protein
MLNFFAQKEQKTAEPVVMDLSIHKNIGDKLNYFHRSNKIPHIIFHGSSGSGKRTIVNNFLNKIYNNDKQKLKTNVMMVNCAHGKGIKFIREELKFFAKTNIQSNNGVTFKTIVLLNADCLTIDAQSALRRCIELFSYNTRFFIIVENKQKLLNPILSRFCEIYVPEHIENGQIVNLHHVAKEKYYQGNLSREHDRQWVNEQMKGIVDIFASSNHSAVIDPSVKGKAKKPVIEQAPSITHDSLVDLSNMWYERGLSCLDLIEWIKSTDLFSDGEKANYCMCFDKIKSEFRCEKLLLFYLLDFIFLRSNKDIKNVLPL